MTGVLKNFLHRSRVAFTDNPAQATVRVQIVDRPELADFAVADDAHRLWITLHHVAGDAVSLDILTAELSACYQGLREGRTPPRASPEQSFLAWASRQHEARRDDDLAWWSAYLRDHEALDLPTDRPRPPTPSFQGAVCREAVTRATLEALDAIGREAGVTRFGVLFVAWCALMHRYTAQRDIVVGAPFHGRTTPESERVVGLFVNTLVLRCEVSGERSLRALLAQSREGLRGAFARHDTPFDVLVERLRPPREPGRTPFFNVMFALQEPASAPLRFGDALTELLDTDEGTAKFDITVDVTPTADGAEVAFDFALDLFDRATVGRMASAFVALLDGAARDPDAPV